MVVRSLFLFMVLLGQLGRVLAAGPNELPAVDQVALYLQRVSVTIKAQSTEGSGVVKTREIDGKQINFVWTAGHVVRNLRRVKEIIDPATGTKRQLVSFRDCQIVKELVEDGRRVGELKMDAEVIRYSEREDLALLRVRKTNFVEASVIFYLAEAIPPIGSELYHVGSLLGQTGANSMTSGIVSQIGRTLDKKIYDQTTATSFPGSSGGGVYLKTGACVGLIVRGAGEGFNLMVPVRRIRKWASSTNIVWAIDDTQPTPTQEELGKIPIEDTGVTFGKGNNSTTDRVFPCLIRNETKRID